MLMAVLLLMQQAPLDTTIAVTADTRLEAFASAGTIDVKVWDKNAVRLVARPERGAVVTARLDGVVLRIGASAPGGGSGIDLVSYEITVPRRMNLTLGRNDVDITVTGTEGSVDASITQGKIAVTGGRGVITLKSVQGPIELSGARGTVHVESQTGQVTLRDVQGDVDARSNLYHVTLEQVDSHNLKASSVGGVIRFSGPVYADGHYTLTTHSGSVFFTSTTPLNATVAVATVTGAFAAQGYEVTDRRRAGIFTARFGNGAAQVSLESFNGGIVVGHP